MAFKSQTPAVKDTMEQVIYLQVVLVSRHVFGRVSEDYLLLADAAVCIAIGKEGLCRSLLIVVIVELECQ